MSTSPSSSSHNSACVGGSDNDVERGYVESGEVVSGGQRTERRGSLPGLPGGPGLGEREPEISDEVLDALLAGASTAQEIAGPDGVLAHLTRRLLNRALEAELSAHLGYEAGQAPPGGAGNARNGKPAKTVITDQGPLRISSPRDRKGTFEPQIVRKRQTRWVGFDEKVISLYARGLTVREIKEHLAEIYGTEVSPDLISKITDAVLEDAKAWQNRPLERLYPIVYLDALVVKIREGQAVRNFACYVAIGVNLDGERDVLGTWFQRTEGAKFWMQVLTELKQRGVADVLFFCVDGLTGFPEAIEATFPHATVQTCLVHQVRNSLKVRLLQGPQASRRRSAQDLHGSQRRPRRRRA
jgi:putative transposase